MFLNDDMRSAGLPAGHAPHRRSGFSLVELLTVIFIIALLIGILIPSLNAARNAAKKTSTKSLISSIGVGMEMFKNDNGGDFPQSNGYPPSFSHPPLGSFGSTFKPYLGEFPFIEDNPVVYGAHWLPAMLMGLDNQGFIKRSVVPQMNPPLDPSRWYTPEAIPGKIIERAPMYVTPENAPIRKTSELPGRKPESSEFFKDWDKMKHLPVFVDAWDQPILYYVANTAGKATNMVETKHKEDNSYSTGDQGKGPPYYFHEDNEGFTGKSDSSDADSGTPGWDLSNTGGKHAIKFSGAELLPDELTKPVNKESFAHYIVDRKIYSNMLSQLEQGKQIDSKTPLRPVNAETFLMISPGVDGKYGTNDDVSNIPQFDAQ